MYSKVFKPGELPIEDEFLKRCSLMDVFYQFIIVGRQKE